MKTLLSVQRAALLALALGTASTTASFAQTTTTPSTTAPTCSAGGKHHDGDSVLTDAEKTQLKAAREKAFAADPSLKQQFETLKSQGKSAATKGQWKALKTQMHAAELTADPTLGPIFAKLDAAHHHST